MKTWEVSDTITIRRTWHGIDARDEQDAIDIVIENGPEPDNEVQIDNTPYDAEIEDTVSIALGAILLLIKTKKMSAKRKASIIEIAEKALRQ